MVGGLGILGSRPGGFLGPAEPLAPGVGDSRVGFMGDAAEALGGAGAAGAWLAAADGCAAEPVPPSRTVDSAVIAGAGGGVDAQTSPTDKNSAAPSAGSQSGVRGSSDGGDEGSTGSLMLSSAD